MVSWPPGDTKRAGPRGAPPEKERTQRGREVERTVVSVEGKDEEAEHEEAKEPQRDERSHHRARAEIDHVLDPVHR